MLSIFCVIAIFLSNSNVHGQALVHFDDINKTPEGLYMNNNKCFCIGIGGTCLGDCGRKFSSAEVTTTDSFQYGRFETRMLASIEADGTVATFFLYKNESDKVEGSSWQEIDYEVHGMGPHGASPIQTNMITGDFVNREISEVFLAAPGIEAEIEAQTKAVKQRFHHFAIEWTPDYITWYFDGRRIRYEVPCAVDSLAKTDPVKCTEQVNKYIDPMHLRLSLWPLDPTPEWAAFWAGVFKSDAGNFPLTIYVDYVKAYEYDVLTKAFKQKWMEDFATLNETRWELGEHTFDVNFAHFSKDHARIVKSETPPKDATRDGSYLAISLAPKNMTLTELLPPKDDEFEDYTRLDPPIVAEVFNDWDPPLQEAVLPAKACGSSTDSTVLLSPDTTFTGGLLAFSLLLEELKETPELTERLKDIETSLKEQTSKQVKLCAAACANAYADALQMCRFYSVHVAEGRGADKYCSGWYLPEAEVASVDAIRGVLCNVPAPLIVPALNIIVKEDKNTTDIKEDEQIANITKPPKNKAQTITTKTTPVPSNKPFLKDPLEGDFTSKSSNDTNSKVVQGKGDFTSKSSNDTNSKVVQGNTTTAKDVANNGKTTTSSPALPTPSSNKTTPTNSTTIKNNTTNKEVAHLAMRLLDAELATFTSQKGKKQLIDIIGKTLNVDQEAISIDKLQKGSVIVKFSVDPMKTKSSKNDLESQWTEAVKTSTSPVGSMFRVDPAFQAVDNDAELRSDSSLSPTGGALSPSGSVDTQGPLIIDSGDGAGDEKGVEENSSSAFPGWAIGLLVGVILVLLGAALLWFFMSKRASASADHKSAASQKRSDNPHQQSTSNQTPQSIRSPTGAV